MEKNSTIRTVLLLIILIPLGFVAFHLFDPDPLAKAKADSQELDRLFRNLSILKVPNVTNPVEINLKNLNGNQVSISDFRGKIVFLNFWTTWCPTCRIEMPSMEKLHQKLQDKNFAMVAINLQESASQVKKFFKEYKLTFMALLDETGDVGAGFGIRAIPTTFILDKTGRIIGKVFGPRQWDSQESVALFEHLTDKYVATSTVGSVP